MKYRSLVDLSNYYHFQGIFLVLTESILAGVMIKRKALDVQNLHDMLFKLCMKWNIKTQINYSKVRLYLMGKLNSHQRDKTQESHNKSHTGFACLINKEDKHLMHLPWMGQMSCKYFIVKLNRFYFIRISIIFRKIIN